MTITHGTTLRTALVIFAFAGNAALADSAAHADLAQAHFAAIGSGDVAGITETYADSAVFEWVGGPLDGRYADAAAIEGVWTKFTGAQGMLDVAVDDLSVHENPAGATVSANVVFTGKMPIPVRYVLTYRGSQIVSETWQIAPMASDY